MKRIIYSSIFISTLLLSSCGGSNTPEDENKDQGQIENNEQSESSLSIPEGEAGAKKIAETFAEGGDEAEKLFQALQPNEEDCKAILSNEEDARKMFEDVSMMYQGGSASFIVPKEGQTDILITQGSIADLKNGAPNDFPGGYGMMADKFNDGLTVYGFKFVKPGESMGMAFDGLIYVNGKWIFAPKMFRSFL